MSHSGKLKHSNNRFVSMRFMFSERTWGGKKKRNEKKKINAYVMCMSVYKSLISVLYIESSGGEHINANKHKYKCKIQ